MLWIMIASNRDPLFHTDISKGTKTQTKPAKMLRLKNDTD